MRRRSSWTGSGLDSFNHILGAMATISVHVRQRSPQHQWMNVGSGRIDLSRDPDLSDFKLLVTSDLSAAPIVQLPLNRSTSIKRDNDSTIIVATAGSSVEHSIKFCDASSCSVVWIALSVLVNGDVVSMVATPTVENIDFMRKYLVSVHPIMRDLVAASVCRTGFTQSLFESFAFAEMSQRFDVLHHFREVL
jgi:hypothetical protein